jgi:hypothetical protein
MMKMINENIWKETIVPYQGTVTVWAWTEEITENISRDGKIRIQHLPSTSL